MTTPTPSKAVGPKFAALKAAIRDIEAIVLAADRAEDYHIRADSVATTLRTGFDQYGNRQVSEDLVPVCREINARIAAEMTLEFKRRRDAEVAKIGMALDSLRVTLPDLAAKACIELGCTARAISSQENQS